MLSPTRFNNRLRECGKYRRKMNSTPSKGKVPGQKLFVGNSGEFRITQPLAAGKLRLDADIPLRLTYRFRQATEWQGELELRLWIDDSFDHGCSPTIRLASRRGALLLQGKTSDMQLACVVSTKIENIAPSTVKGPRLHTLQLKTTQRRWEVGEQIVLELSLNSSGSLKTQYTGTLHCGGKYPSVLIAHKSIPVDIKSMLIDNASEQSMRQAPKRELILEAAEDCFSQRGFSGTSISDISAASGLSHGHIYNFFDSKDAIIRECIERHLAEDNRVIVGSTTGVSNTDELLTAFETIIQKIFFGPRSTLFCEICAEANRNKPIANLVQYHEAELQRHFVSLLGNIECGQPWKQTEQPVLARVEVIFAMLHGLRIRFATESEEESQAMITACRPALTSLVEH
jgi:AcrR family transcriptional regulator